MIIKYETEPIDFLRNDSWECNDLYDDIVNSGKETEFNDLIEDLKNNNEFESDPLKQSIINDICNNPKAFEGIVANVFAQYGIKANVKKFS